MHELIDERNVPCPGMSDPESLTPASRLIMDSIRSPNKDPTKFKTPKAAALLKI